MCIFHFKRKLDSQELYRLFYFLDLNLVFFHLFVVFTLFNKNYYFKTMQIIKLKKSLCNYCFSMRFWNEIKPTRYTTKPKLGLDFLAARARGMGVVLRGPPSLHRSLIQRRVTNEGQVLTHFLPSKLCKTYSYVHSQSQNNRKIHVNFATLQFTRSKHVAGSYQLHPLQIFVKRDQ
jgi:hypothetical protein